MIRYSNYWPAEINSIHDTRAEAEKEFKELGGHSTMWQIEEWENTPMDAAKNRIVNAAIAYLRADHEENGVELRELEDAIEELGKAKEPKQP